MNAEVAALLPPGCPLFKVLLTVAKVITLLPPERNRYSSFQRSDGGSPKDVHTFGEQSTGHDATCSQARPLD